MIIIKIKKVFKKSIQIGLLIIGVSLLGIGARLENYVTPVYAYTAEKSSHYSVILQPNTFYTSDVLPEGQCYASQSIQSYQIPLDYKLQGSQVLPIQYQYMVTAELVGIAKSSENEDKEVWHKEETLIEKKQGSETERKEIQLHEEVSIDYPYYNQLARAYEKTYGIVIDAVLKVRFQISYAIDIAGLQEINDTIELDIPITNTVSEVQEVYEKTTSGNCLPDTNRLKIICYGIGSVCIGSILLKEIVCIYANKTKAKEYAIHIQCLLKTYQDFIITIKENSLIENDQIVDVQNFEDIHTIAEQNQTHILHYVKKEGKEDWFYVLVGNYVYRVCLKVE